MAACASPSDVIVLLADENYKVGKVVVTSNDGGKVVLQKSLASAHNGSDGLTKAKVKQVRVDVILKTSSPHCRRTRNRLFFTSEREEQF